MNFHRIRTFKTDFSHQIPRENHLIRSGKHMKLLQIQFNVCFHIHLLYAMLTLQFLFYFLDVLSFPPSIYYCFQL